jgi:hypothetical protein
VHCSTPHQQNIHTFPPLLVALKNAVLMGCYIASAAVHGKLLLLLLLSEP